MPTKIPLEPTFEALVEAHDRCHIDNNLHACNLPPIFMGLPSLVQVASS